MVNGSAQEAKKMYRGKIISVAIATYNGEKYIREQLDSILNQTVVPDEIVISDDGSTDQTIKILQEIANSHQSKIHLYSDNPRHGFAYNFGYAVSHCSGDILFLCDQDDIWAPEKVERISEVYCNFPDALCVFHNAASIDSEGNPCNILFNSYVQSLADQHSYGEVVKVPGDPNCEIAASAPLINGMIMSVSKELLKTAFPFPPIPYQHDGWLWFCSEALDGCYYLNEILTSRRLHSSNTSGAGRQGFGVHRIKKILHHIAKQNEYARIRIVYSQYMQEYIQLYCSKDNAGAMHALSTILRINEMGCAELSAARAGRLSGAIQLTRLYFHNTRYRRSGGKMFLYELADIILRSKKKRLQSLNQIMTEVKD